MADLGDGTASVNESLRSFFKRSNPVHAADFAMGATLGA